MAFSTPRDTFCGQKVALDVLMKQRYVGHACKKDWETETSFYESCQQRLWISTTKE
jgi:hypothetical protein